MIKRKLKLFLVFFVVLPALFSAAIPYSGANGTALSGDAFASSLSFPQIQKNDYFSSPAGIFITEEAGGRVIYAADKKMGVLMYGSGGSIEKIFKRSNREYKKVFVYQDFIITLENNTLAFFDINKEARPAVDYIAGDPDGLRAAAFTDIAVDGGAVWGIAGDSLYKIGITASAGGVSLISQNVYGKDVLGLKNVTSVAAAGDRILLAADRNFGKALYLYDFINAPVYVADFSDGINDIAVFESGGSYSAAVAHQKYIDLIALPHGGIKASFSPASLALSEGGIASASCLYSYNEELYVCDTASRATAVLTLPELAFNGLLFASSGSEPGRLNGPEGVCVWDDKLFIADRLNRRVQVWDKDGAVNVFGGDGVPLIDPSAVAADALGRVYVVDNKTRIVKYGADYKYVSSTEIDGARITGIAAAADGIIYISDSLNGKILAADIDVGGSLEFSEYCSVGNPVSVCASLNQTSLYVLTADGGIVRLDKAPGGTVTPVDINKGGAALNIENITAFTADCGNNLIALRRNPASESTDIVKFVPVSGNTYTETETLPFPAAYGAYEYAAYDIRHMAFSPVSGEVYLADSLKSRIYPLTPAEAGAAPFSDADRINYGSSEALTSYTVAQLSAQTPLYEMPLVSKASGILPRGTSLAVLARNVEGNDYYSFVYLPSSNKAGYVLKTLLEPDNAPDAPLFAEGRIFNDGTPVYKFPSRLAPRVHNEEGALNLPKDKKVKLAPHSKAADAGPEKWYCIELDGGRLGFVSALNVANYKYRPTESILSTNADIVKSKDDGGAFMYEEDCVTLMDVPPLTDGCRVKVVGSFNANAKFTEVIYQDDELGLIQGYVLTKYIKYDTTTNLQFIMLALLIVLAAVAAAAVYIFKRKKARAKR